MSLVFPNVEGEAYGMMWGVEKGIEEEETQVMPSSSGICLVFQVLRKKLVE